MRIALETLAVAGLLALLAGSVSLAAEELSPAAQEALEHFADPKTPDSGFNTRVTYRDTLIQQGPVVVPALTNLLMNSKVFAVRLNAIIGIVMITEKDPAAAKPVLEHMPALLAAPEAPIRAWAVKLAGASKDTASVPKLLERLSGDTDPVMQEELVLALGKIGDEQALRPLQELLQRDGDGNLRACAADALKALNKPEAVSTLLKCLKDPDPRVQGACAEALTTITGCFISFRPDDTTAQVDQKIALWQKCWDAKQK